MEIKDTILDRRMFVEKISAIDALEQVRSYLINKRFPIKIIIYPEATMRLTIDSKLRFEF